MLATSALCALSIAGAANAQTADDTVEEIVVVGSQIEGAKVTAALPVTVVDQAQLANVAATSGDDLFRSIPQMGDVSFNSSYLPNSSNSARGDVGSVNLRNLGVNTQNGRWIAEVASGSEWRTVEVPFSALKRTSGRGAGTGPWTGNDVLEITVDGGRPGGEKMWLEIDNVSFY